MGRDDKEWRGISFLEVKTESVPLTQSPLPTIHLLPPTDPPILTPL
jgi:hypothetical protein